MPAESSAAGSALVKVVAPSEAGGVTAAEVPTAGASPPPGVVADAAPVLAAPARLLPGPPPAIRLVPPPTAGSMKLVLCADDVAGAKTMVVPSSLPGVETELIDMAGAVTVAVSAETVDTVTTGTDVATAVTVAGTAAGLASVDSIRAGAGELMVCSELVDVAVGPLYELVEEAEVDEPLELSVDPAVG